MKRTSIRILVALTLAAASTAFIAVPVPRDAHDQPELPAVALGQDVLYRVEVALVVFYGGLLLITPAFSGLAAGRLPVEISARGAKFAEEADQSNDVAITAIENLEETSNSLSEALAAALSRIEVLEQLPRDNTQPKVDSKP